MELNTHVLHPYAWNLRLFLSSKWNPIPISVTQWNQCLFTSPFLSLRWNPIPIFSPRWNRTPISFIQIEPNAHFFHPPGTQWPSYTHMAPKAHFQMEPNASFTLMACSICLIPPLRNPLSINFSWMKTQCPFLSLRYGTNVHSFVQG